MLTDNNSINNHCRTYDIRIVTGVHNYDEEKVPDCVKAVAEKITTSLIRLILKHKH